jgi:hypothetical protein
VPRALESINRRFDQRKATEWLAVEILKGVKVFMGKTETDVHHIVDELQEMTDDELKDYINKRVNNIAAGAPGTSGPCTLIETTGSASELKPRLL